MNNKIVSIKTTSAIFLAIVLFTGTIAAISSSSSSFMTNAQTQPSYYYDGGMDYNNNNYYKSEKDNSKNVSINKIKCINDNININGENAGDVNAGNKEQGYLDANSYGSGYYDGYGNTKQDKGFDDCVINNNNTNTNINLGGGNQTIPSATLTVKKQVFGCVTSSPVIMDCFELQNNSPAWRNCNNDPLISGSVFCQSLPESLFDIQVLDDQNTLIQKFVGSEQGTTIQNLEPGTYTVNEIKYPTISNRLGENAGSEEVCVNAGFPDGGSVLNTTTFVDYSALCFEYEDEQGNDCSTITLAAGEERTCTVKNYIKFAVDS